MREFRVKAFLYIEASDEADAEEFANDLVGSMAIKKALIRKGSAKCVEEPKRRKKQQAHDQRRAEVAKNSR